MADDLDQNSRDYVVAAAKSALGAVPFAGSLLVELAGTIIPRQRIDRLTQFARQLEERLAAHDRDSVRAKLSDENFTDLMEETTRQAAQAVTDERRAYLAALLAQGVSPERISFVETKHLLRILSEINDIEVVWLRFYLNPVLDGDHEFRARHAAVLEPVAAHLGSDQVTVDKQALQENYLEHLVSLGLLNQPFDMDRSSGYPRFDKHRRRWATKGHNVTPLGRLLLRHIGLNDD